MEPVKRMNWSFHLKLTKEQKERLVALSRAAGFNQLSSYMRFMLLNPSLDQKLNRILEIVKDIQERIDLIEFSKKEK
jgi:hypothetical protein